MATGLFGELDDEPRPPRRRAKKPAAPKVDAPPVEPPKVVANVALARPVRTEFSYTIPVELEGAVTLGVRVRVPFGRRTEVGVVVAVGPPSDKDLAAAHKLRAIERCLDTEPVVDAPLLDLTRWMATQYGCAWGEALGAILPAPLKRERQTKRIWMARATEAATPEALAELEEKSPEQHRLLRTLLGIEGEIGLRDLTNKLGLSESPARTLAKKGLVELRSAAFEPFEVGEQGRERSTPPELFEAQAWAVDAISHCVETRKHRSFLLEGVTGSGKTEVYLRVIERALAAGRSAIVLVPEISLTPQTVGWFRSRFNDVAVLHSRMTDAQRLSAWRRARHGEARVIVGARSAVFAPVVDLGVIVIDEEHEPSFKQASTPRYHARDVALERARREGAVCVLGSATPALETWHAARTGVHAHLSLPERVGGRPMPRVEIVDMRTEPTGEFGALFSRNLRQHLEGALQRGEQGILFLNRRGYAPVLWCPGCRTTVRCAQCDVPMTWHRDIDRLVCHLCQNETAVPRNCPTCSAPGGRMIGAGSERVERTLRKLFPSARVARMDSDTMHRREDYERTLSAFGSGELDFLVGTQMIAKGLDFPRVTVVGIVSADTSLHLPDFRSAERTFQLISQVAGRAGRADLAGHIVVQTENPEHPAVRFAARHDFTSFAEAELVSRRELGYPPFGRILRAVFEDEDGSKAASVADSACQALHAALDGTDAVVLGPAPAPMSLVRGRYRHHLLVKTPVGSARFATARELLLELAESTARPRIGVDVDPMGML
ncbi:replication restart helicase PriA [Engelhardtia mirabilis]|uniref:Replication restart protein PriA n=1 Tax=Engelhardtia mirabilis TaxID=2528011 RepID=A0A518BRS9_9BACT|nr:Primosomal protein N' [Planctomycetes bacterium Pla133]QDV04005.1 Primosomal protein N' [Planctomycetes bacterium Pla86]